MPTDKLIDQLTVMLVSIQSAASTELPLIAQQLLEWEFRRAAGISILCLLAIIFLAALIRIGIKENEKGNDCCSVIAFFVLLMTLPIGLWVGTTCDMLKIKHAPKIYLLDEVQSRIKAVR